MDKKVGTEYLKDESSYTGDAEDIIFIKDKTDIEKNINKSKNITVQGSRTGISASAVPEGGIIFNMSQLNGEPALGEDEKGLYIDCPAKTTIDEVDRLIRRKESEGYFLPIEPTETSSTIGGTIAANAQGPSPLKRYKTSDFIEEADVFFPVTGWMNIKKGQYVFDDEGLILPEDQKIKIEYLPEDEFKAIDILTPKKGMDLLELLSGSEGMIGIIGSVRLRLLKRKKIRWKLLFFAETKDSEYLLKSILKLADEQKNIELLALDMMDAKSIDLLKGRLGTQTKYEKIPELPDGAVQAFLIDVTSDDSEETDIFLENILSILDEAGVDDDAVWAADSKDEQETINIFRHAVPESINAYIEDAKRKCPLIRKVSLDVQAEDADIDEVRRVAESADIPFAMIAHYGRKVFHIDFLPEDEAGFIKAIDAKEKMINFFADHKALFAAENGYGKGKYEGLEKYISPSQKVLIENVKKTFDPEGILNGGNLWL